MKVAVTATGNYITSLVDPRFGRAKYFIVVDTETETSSIHENTQNRNAVQGAGIQAGETVVRLGVQAVVTANVGPKAFRILSAAGIRVFRSGPDPVTEAIRKFRAGELPELTVPSVDGHWV